MITVAATTGVILVIDRAKPFLNTGSTTHPFITSVKIKNAPVLSAGSFGIANIIEKSEGFLDLDEVNRNENPKAVFD
jgi:hypothetical protein